MTMTMSKAMMGMDLSSSELVHEEDVLRRPYVVKSWLGYLEALDRAPPRRRFLVYERALAALPGSYKLWHAYLVERVRYCAGKHPSSAAHDRLDATFQRALVYMHKMPVIWEMYCQFVIEQRKWTQARRTCDAALRALPVTQHGRIWPLFLRFSRECAVPETGARILRRYTKLEPEAGAEELFGYLVDCHRYDDAASVLSEALERPDFKGRKKTRQQLWTMLAELAVVHATAITSVDVDALIRGGIRAAKEESGEMWVLLAEYYARTGIFERSRDIYEEALETVNTVRDFAVIFDAYAKFEEGLVTAKMASFEETESVEKGSNVQLEMLISRLERLTDRRPFLLSSVILRQNPHNVHEWHKRARLYAKRKNATATVNAYTQAVKTVDPWKASNGRPHTLWLAFARFYEDHKDLSSSRQVFEKAVISFDKFRGAEDLAAVWCEYVEFELRHGDFDAAEKLLQRATTEPKRAVRRGNAKPQGNALAVLGAGSGGVITHNYDKELPSMKAWRSTRLWSLYADFEESVGGVDRAMKVYEPMLDLKIATMQNVISATEFLEENHYFENAFKIYERGLALFKWPTVLPLQIRYLKLFISRFGGRKLERARELFEEAIAAAPVNDPHLRVLFLLYADMEEGVGLARRAMDVYARGVRSVQPEQRVDLYRVYAAKAVEMFGVTRTRLVLEDALEVLTDRSALAEFSQRFASLEVALGEIDRARAIYAHGSQFADPRGADNFQKFWSAWDEFELAHGSEDTYKEMLRIKRSVQTQYSHVNIAAAGKPPIPAVEEAKPTVAVVDAGMEALERQAEAVRGKEPTVKNTEEIEVDLDEDEQEEEDDESAPKKNAGEVDEEKDGDAVVEGVPLLESRKRKADDVEVEEKPIPAAVFGGLKDGNADAAEDSPKKPRNAPLGALERLKRKRV